MRFKGLIAAVFLAMVAMQTAGALSMGVSPASASVKNVLAGGEAKQDYYINNPNSEEIGVQIAVSGDISEWLDVEQDNILIPAGKTAKVPVIIRAPAGTANGNYNGILKFNMKSFNPVTGAYKAQSGVITLLSLSVVDSEVMEYSIDSVNIINSEKPQDIVLEFRVQNTGNVPIMPASNVGVYDVSQKGLLLETGAEHGQILPYEGASIAARIPTGSLDVANYLAFISIYGNKGDAPALEKWLPLRVYGEGTFSIKGEITSSNINATAVGEPIYVRIAFRNTGDIAVPVRQVTELYYGERLEAVIEGEERVIQAGEEITLLEEVNPKNAGEYRVRTKVYYGNKETSSVSERITVGNSVDGSVAAYAAAIVVVILAVSFIFGRRS